MENSAKLKISFFLVIVTLFPFLSSGQEKTEWSSSYKLKAEDFKAPAPNSGSIQTVYGHTTIEYQLMNYQLLTSRNFNDKITCYFFKNASWLDEGESTHQLIRYAQAVFNLNEWMTRELRKIFRENRGKILAGKHQEFYNQKAEEFARIQSEYSRETDFGRIEEKQIAWEAKIQQRLNELSEFCKECKPGKIKR